MKGFELAQERNHKVCGADLNPGVDPEILTTIPEHLEKHLNPVIMIVTVYLCIFFSTVASQQQSPGFKPCADPDPFCVRIGHMQRKSLTKQVNKKCIRMRLILSMHSNQCPSLLIG